MKDIKEQGVRDERYRLRHENLDTNQEQIDRQQQGSCVDYLHDDKCYPDIVNSYRLDFIM